MSAEIDRAQLARILGMLGSTHDGEALAAGRMAERSNRPVGVGRTCDVLPVRVAGHLLVEL